MTSFIIQASNPHSAADHDVRVDSLGDAIETVFPLNTEDALLIWNHIYVPLSYKYDIAIIMSDVLDIIEAIHASPQSSHSVHWPSNTFAAIWNMRWDQGMIEVQSKWNCVVGGTEALLVSKPEIRIPCEDFVAEWKRPLQIAERALAKAGYSVEQVSELGRLQTVLANCNRDGQLYRDY